MLRNYSQLSELPRLFFGAGFIGCPLLRASSSPRPLLLQEPDDLLQIGADAGECVDDGQDVLPLQSLLFRHVVILRNRIELRKMTEMDMFNRASGS